jgi:hypothetical protein
VQTPVKGVHGRDWQGPISATRLSEHSELSRCALSTLPTAPPDPLEAFDATGASFLPLAEGYGDTHISCFRVNMGGKIEAPSITHDAALFVAHGRITIEPKL